MNTIELKRSFHNLIDSIENENLLMNFYELMKNRTSGKDGKLWARLSLEEQESLLQTIEETKNPDNVISHSEMKKKHKKWL
jgi:nitrate reductase NapAB chaperone NapD